MTARIVSEPGRSGAIAAVYASHLLGVPTGEFGHPPCGVGLLQGALRSRPADRLRRLANP